MNEEISLEGYGSMKKYLINFLTLLLVNISTGGSSFAEENITIKTKTSENTPPIEVRMLKSNSDFYQLNVLIGGVQKITNDELIPTKSVRNAGGLEVFRGIAIANEHLILNFYFCSPSSSICLDRQIFIDLSNDIPSVAREETTAFSGSLAVRATLYNNAKISANTLNYKYLLENDSFARNAFTDMYGTCISSLGGDSVSTIVDELEKNTPSSWLLDENCITPQLVMALNYQRELSKQVTDRYLQEFISQ